jgi:leader peptidase (prepilin peptidase)/N-methyltransferase
VHVSVVTWAAVPLLGLVAVEDLRHRRIRNRHVLLLSVVAAVSVAVAYVDGDRVVVLRAVLGAVMAAVPLLVAALARPAQMGGGDVKLAAAVGALLGQVSPWFSSATIAGALVLAVVVAAWCSSVRVPLGPPLATTAMVALLVASAVA